MTNSSEDSLHARNPNHNVSLTYKTTARPLGKSSSENQNKAFIDYLGYK